MPNANKQTADDDDEAPVALSRITWKRGRHAGKGTPLSLRTIREGVSKTQVDVADASGIPQSAVSKIEARDLTSTSVGVLRRYVEALGGRLELVAAFPSGHRLGISTSPPRVLEEESKPRPRDRRRRKVISADEPTHRRR
jgi:transcriptional regulator with XRE-family HTH domain